MPDAFQQLLQQQQNSANTGKPMGGGLGALGAIFGINLSDANGMQGTQGLFGSNIGGLGCDIHFPTSPARAICKNDAASSARFTRRLITRATRHSCKTVRVLSAPHKVLVNRGHHDIAEAHGKAHVDIGFHVDDSHHHISAPLDTPTSGLSRAGSGAGSMDFA